MLYLLYLSCETLLASARLRKERYLPIKTWSLAPTLRVWSWDYLTKSLESCKRQLFSLGPIAAGCNNSLAS